MKLIKVQNLAGEGGTPGMSKDEPFQKQISMFGLINPKQDKQRRKKTRQKHFVFLCFAEIVFAYSLFKRKKTLTL